MMYRQVYRLFCLYLLDMLRVMYCTITNGLHTLTGVVYNFNWEMSIVFSFFPQRFKSLFFSPKKEKKWEVQLYQSLNMSYFFQRCLDFVIQAGIP